MQPSYPGHVCRIFGYQACVIHVGNTAQVRVSSYNAAFLLQPRCGILTSHQTSVRLLMHARRGRSCMDRCALDALINRCLMGVSASKNGWGPLKAGDSQLFKAYRPFDLLVFQFCPPPQLSVPGPNWASEYCHLGFPDTVFKRDIGDEWPTRLVSKAEQKGESPVGRGPLLKGTQLTTGGELSSFRETHMQ